MLRSLVILLLAFCVTIAGCTPKHAIPNDERSEVVFWHFWGGRDLPVVEDVIRRFNDSQDRYRVRGIAMPGANLDLKLFLAIAGGDPPDVMNHDDPVVADWAHRAAITSLTDLASPAEVDDLRDWLYPAAVELGSYDGQLYALVNGLDIRALYYNKTALREAGLSETAERGPRTIEELDRLAETITPAGTERFDRVGYLPDPRRLWAWGTVFGGSFGDAGSADPSERVTADDPRVLAALKWMAGYSHRYGADRVAAFRSGDQALTGASFPLLADRRYTVMMDGQWRVRDLAEAIESGSTKDEFGVCPLPTPPGGTERAGWVNGNFFVVPRGAKNPRGAWEFMKFWCGLGGHEAEAARTSVSGGWIPASPRVAEQAEFQAFLHQRPLFAEFVELAASRFQRPTPAVPVASSYYREVVAAAQDVLYRGAEVRPRLRQAVDRVRQRLEESLHE